MKEVFKKSEAEVNIAGGTSKAVPIRIPQYGENVLKPLPAGGFVELVEKKYVGKRSKGVLCVHTHKHGLGKIYIEKGNIIRCDLETDSYQPLRHLQAENHITRRKETQLKKYNFNDLELELINGCGVDREVVETVKRNMLLSNLATINQRSNDVVAQNGLPDDSLLWCWYENVEMPNSWLCTDVDRRVAVAAILERAGQWGILKKNFPQLFIENATPQPSEMWEIFENEEPLGQYREVVKHVDGVSTVENITALSGFSQFEAISALAKALNNETVTVESFLSEEEQEENIDLDFDFYDHYDNEESDINRSYARLRKSVLGGQYGLSHGPIHLAPYEMEKIAELFAKAERKITNIKNHLVQSGYETITPTQHSLLRQGIEPANTSLPPAEEEVELSTVFAENELEELGVTEKKPTKATKAKKQALGADMEKTKSYEDWEDSNEGWGEEEVIYNEPHMRKKHPAEKTTRRGKNTRDNSTEPDQFITQNDEEFNEQPQYSEQGLVRGKKNNQNFSRTRGESEELPPRVGRYNKRYRDPRYTTPHPTVPPQSRYYQQPNQVYQEYPVVNHHGWESPEQHGPEMYGYPPQHVPPGYPQTNMRTQGLRRVAELLKEKDNLERALIHQASVTSVLLSRLESISSELENYEN